MQYIRKNWKIQIKEGGTTWCLRIQEQHIVNNMTNNEIAYFFLQMACKYLKANRIYGILSIRYDKYWSLTHNITSYKRDGFGEE